MPRKLSVSESKQRIARFCAFRERSPKEVQDKLKGFGLEEEEIKSIIRELEDQNFISEERFANAFCHDKFEFNGWGKQKIRASILPHFLDSRIIDQALERIDKEKYLAKLKDLAHKKWNSLEKVDVMVRKQKTTNFLASRGYELDLIRQAVEALNEG